MALREFRLPDPGEGLTEADIVTWHVKVGDTVKVNDVVVEIETAKSLVELPVPFAGTVSALHVAEGDTVEVGTPIISVDDGRGRPPRLRPPAAPPPPSRPRRPPTRRPARRTTRSARGSSVARPRPGAPPSSSATASSRPRPSAAPARAVLPEKVDGPGPVAEGTEVAIETVELSGEGLRVLAKPPVRKLAKDLGVDLGSVTPSGDGGVVTRADVEAAASGAATAAPTAPGDAAPAAPAGASRRRRRPAPGERETRVPVKGVRKMTAQAMVGSAFTAPHVTEWVTLDVTATMDLVDRLKRDKEFKDVKVTPLLVLAKAMCVAIRRNPEINASWDEAAQEIVHKHYVNLGIAAATPRGLVVPNVKDADTMSMRELAEAIGALTATAREGRTQPAEMSGGTITITNVGVFGVDAGTPILNPGEAAILAFGAVNRRPWVVTGADGSESIEPRWVTTLALSFDHRLVDGELGSRYLADVAALLRDPSRGLVWG